MDCLWTLFSTREWAVIVWGLVLVLGVLAWSQTRTSAVDVVKAFGHWRIQLVFWLFVAWIVMVVLGARKLGAWTPELIADTLFWFAASGLVLLFTSHEAAKRNGFFRRAALGSVSAAAVMQFVLNLHTFQLPVELVLQPLIAFLVMFQTVATAKPETKPAAAVAAALLAIVGLAMVAATARGLWVNREAIVGAEVVRAFAFSIWFPLAVLPFIFVLALAITYEQLFNVRAYFRNGQKSVPQRVKVAILAGLHGDVRAVRELSRWGGFHEVARATTFRSAYAGVARYKRDRAKTVERDRLEAVRMRTYAGNRGYRADGTLLDQREFTETQKALRWLHVCHMGHYRNRGRYRADLMTLIDFERQDLPTDHGVVAEVRRDGQAWRAWRRTVTGRVFGLGVVNGEPTGYYFEGPDEPRGWPGDDGTDWVHEFDRLPTHWR